MIRGMYTAGTGMKNCAANINVAGNNITNAATAGYKKDTVTAKSFGSYLTYRMDGETSQSIGSAVNGVTPDKVYTSYEQGTLQNTGRGLDLALEGEGFFTVQNANGEELLTRNGSFSVNADGYLTDTAGNLVLGTGGPINVGTSDITVTTDGEILADGASCGILRLACPENMDNLSKAEGTCFFSPSGPSGEFAGSVRQGFLENSNVDATEEMTNMMLYSRSYQSCSQMIKMMDRIMDKTVNEIAKF